MYHQFFSWLRSALLSVGGGALCAASANAAAETVKVGVYQSAPKVFVDENGQASGFFPAILNHVAEREGWAIEYVPCAWNACLAMVESGALDLMPDVAFSRERAARFDFNDEVALSNWSTLYVAKGGSIGSMLDVDGRRIAVVKGGIQHAMFRDWTLSVGVKPGFVEVDGSRQVFEAIADGRADGGLVNRLFGAQFAERYGVQATHVVMAPSQLHFVSAKDRGWRLLAALDRHLAAAKETDGSFYQQALERWVRPLEVERFPAWTKWVVLGLVGVLGVALGFATVLRREVGRKTRELAHTNMMLRALTAVNETLVRADTEQELLDRTCRAATDVGPFFMACIAYANQEGERPVERVAGVCVNDQRLDDAAQQEWIDALIGIGPLETAIRTGESIVDWHLPARLYPFSNAGGKPVSIAAFPLFVDRRPIGAFCLGSHVLDSFTDDMVALLTQMAEDLSFGVQTRRDTQLRRQMSKRLQQSEKMDALGDLAGGIAHDLKNMLLPIITLTKMTHDDLPDEGRAKKRLAKVIEAAERARSLTERIHAFSHTDEGVFEVLPVCRLIDDCVKMIRPVLPSSIALDVACGAEDRDWTIRVDPARFQTMFLNLGSNAADAMDGGVGAIHVTAERTSVTRIDPMDIPVPKPGEYVKLVFSDTGSGMDESTVRRIFEPYFSTKERGKGTGLGMAMVQKFVVDHDGGISVFSEPGRGTAFNIFLPVTAPVAA